MQANSHKELQSQLPDWKLPNLYYTIYSAQRAIIEWNKDWHYHSQQFAIMRLSHKRQNLFTTSLVKATDFWIYANSAIHTDIGS